MNNVKTTVFNSEKPIIDRINLSGGEDSIILLDSGLGTGKTQLAKKIAKQYKDKKILYIAPSISLAEAAANDFQFISYLDKNFHSNQEKVTICCNSILKVKANFYDLVIIDEPDQVLQMLLGATIKNFERLVIMDYLVKIVKYSGASLMLQYNISEDIYELIKRAERINDVHLYKNEHQAWQNVKASKIDGHFKDFLGYLLCEANDLKSNGKKFTVPCSSRKKVSEISIALRKEGLHVLEIHSSNSNDKAQKDFFRNPSQTSVHYDCIVYSPKVSSGVSIINEDYTSVIGGLIISEYSSITPETFIQMLGRNRTVKKISYWVTSTMMNSETRTEEEIIKSVLSLRDMQLSLAGDQVVVEPYNLTWADKKRIRLEIKQEKEKINAENEIKAALKQSGINNIDKQHVDKNTGLLGKEAMKEAREIKIEEAAECLAKTDDISIKEYSSLKKQSNLTSEQSLQILRFDINQNLVVSLAEESKDDIKKLYKLHESDQIHRKADLWEIGFMSDILVKRNAIKTVKMGDYPSTFLGTLFVKQRVISNLMKFLQIKYKKGNISYDSEFEFTILDLIKSELGEYVRNNKEIINISGLGGKISKNNLSSKVVSLWLSNMGIHIAPKVSRKDGKVARTYTIKNITPEIQELLERRHQKGVTFNLRLKKNLDKVFANQHKNIDRVETEEEIGYIMSMLGLDTGKKAVTEVRKISQTKQAVKALKEIRGSL